MMTTRRETWQRQAKTGQSPFDAFGGVAQGMRAMSGKRKLADDMIDGFALMPEDGDRKRG